jgi:protein farnesyltransferase/geranylgeranyltransferase type-1 subunit alpha
MDHFRAISLAKEHSERALELTETIIRMNPAHYTVWYAFEVRKSGS